ncbi:MAG: TIGR00730 family Rossman fold protein [Firmicutes bacterium]|nr:TIGR00730 family Rossman fold protein [Bacillota bacterium]
MNITVYCGARIGNRSEYADAARDLGRWIGENGHTLVYGGGKYGMMGTLADAVLATGGEVIGITPALFIEQEVIHPEIQTVEVVPSMADRRSRMIELGDVLIAMPGGVGTLDEISEAIGLNKLGYIDSPCIFFNVCGYYDSTFALLQEMVDEGFYEQEHLDTIINAKGIGDIDEALN